MDPAFEYMIAFSGVALLCWISLFIRVPDRKYNYDQSDENE